MTTPNKAEIKTRARELYVEHCYKSGCPELAEVNPEDHELIEGGFTSQAVSELMTDRAKAALENDFVDFPQAFSVDINEIFESNGLILGSRHTGKSDIAMKISDEATKKDAVIVVFDPSTDWLKRSCIKQYVKVKAHMVLDVPNESTIYDISMLSPIQQQRTVEQFSKKLFESQAQALHRRQYLVIFEEAHTYFFQGSMRAKAMQNTVKLVSVGRNIDIACVLISQFAAMLDKFVVKHATSQMWLGFTKEPNDLRYLGQIIGEDVDALTRLEDGEFVCVTREKASKIVIDPYENTCAKTEIASELKPFQTVKPVQTHDNAKALTSLLIAAMWFVAILYALSQRCW